MGNASSQSAPSKQLTREQLDIQFLAERFPFGDKELKHLYTVYHVILSADYEKVSFLSDWAVQCQVTVASGKTDPDNVNDDQDAIREQRRAVMQVVEEHILSSQFGNYLYKTSFLPPGDESMYETNEANLDSATAVPTSKQATISSNTTDEYTRKARLEAFFQGVTETGRKGTKAAVSAMFAACFAVPSKNDSTSQQQQQQDMARRVRAIDLIEMGYRVALATVFLQKSQTTSSSSLDEYFPVETPSSDKTLVALASSLVQHARSKQERNSILSSGERIQEKLLLLQEGLVELEDILDWTDTVAPLFGSILPTFFHHILFPGQAYPPSRTAFDFPRVLSESTFFLAPNASLLFTCGCLSPALNGSYFRLYTSASDGLSFNRLQNALLGYAGPTLLLVQAAGNGGIFGAFTASPWKETRDFYGNSDCFLFQLAPTTAIYRPTGNNQNFMYCNSFARSRGYDQQAHGIGFGGTVTQPRLFLAESFDDCFAGNQDLTFENGSLLPLTESGAVQKYFEIDCLEVWGVGGDDVVMEALGARDKARAIKEEGIQRARKVDKAQFLDDLRSGVIDSKAFKFRQEIDGRADQDVDDRYKQKFKSDE